MSSFAVHFLVSVSFQKKLLLWLEIILNTSSFFFHHTILYLYLLMSLSSIKIWTLWGQWESSSYPWNWAEWLTIVGPWWMVEMVNSLMRIIDCFLSSDVKLQYIISNISYSFLAFVIICLKFDILILYKIILHFEFIPLLTNRHNHVISKIYLF